MAELEQVEIRILNSLKYKYVPSLFAACLTTMLRLKRRLCCLYCWSA